MGRRFTKMQGLGNDFVVFDATQQPLVLGPEQCRHIADRHFGIGCDQILLIEPAESEEADFGYRIFNADGSEVAQCGNGARAIARYIREKGLSDKDDLVVDTARGRLTLALQEDGLVRVAMGRPEFEPAKIPLSAPEVMPDYALELRGYGEVEFAALALGNPHAVIRVDAVDKAPVTFLGPLLETHNAFPDRANVGFMQVVEAGHVKLRVWERGAGETLACGSGACAAMVAGRRWGLLDEEVAVELAGGILNVQWSGEEDPVYMTGPAETVFEGEIEL